MLPDQSIVKAANPTGGRLKLIDTDGKNLASPPDIGARPWSFLEAIGVGGSAGRSGFLSELIQGFALAGMGMNMSSHRPDLWEMPCARQKPPANPPSRGLAVIAWRDVLTDDSRVRLEQVRLEEAGNGKPENVTRRWHLGNRWRMGNMLRRLR